MGLGHDEAAGFPLEPVVAHNIAPKFYPVLARPGCWSCRMGGSGGSLLAAQHHLPARAARESKLRWRLASELRAWSRQVIICISGSERDTGLGQRRATSH